MGKKENVYGLLIAFDNKIVIGSYSECIHLWYQPDDRNYFLLFDPGKKKFKEWKGFGRTDKISNSYWFRNPRYNWEEKDDN